MLKVRHYLIPNISRKMRNLAAVSTNEQNEFFRSFDQILCDVDGVLYTPDKKISGASETIKLFKKLGKKLIFVSNNTLKTHEDYYNKIKSEICDLEKTDLVTPTAAMIDYLKQLNFSKDIYVIGMTPLKRDLQRFGFKICEDVPEIGDSVIDFIDVCLSGNAKVGAVILDIDLNTNVLKLQKAVTFLKKFDVIFITGSLCKVVPLGHNSVAFGPGYLYNILEDVTGRKGLCLAKPSPDFNNFLREKHRIDDSSRVLMIGDSIEEDMSFATTGGYKKLLVLSGWTQKEMVKNWTFSETLKPNYYVDSLKTVHDILIKLKLLNNKVRPSEASAKYIPFTFTYKNRAVKDLNVVSTNILCF